MMDYIYDFVTEEYISSEMREVSTSTSSIVVLFWLQLRQKRKQDSGLCFLKQYSYNWICTICTYMKFLVDINLPKTSLSAIKSREEI
jgi:hypothetical protein